MTIVSSASTHRGTIGKVYTKTKVAGIRTPAARVSRTAISGAHTSNSTIMPVHVDTASAIAVAAKNIFIGSELGGGVAGVLALASGSQVSDHPALPHQTLPNWVEKPFVEEAKAFPSYAILRYARGCWEVHRNCHERSRADRTSVDHL